MTLVIFTNTDIESQGSEPEHNPGHGDHEGDHAGLHLHAQPGSAGTRRDTVSGAGPGADNQTPLTADCP